jgi:hypothetical protein
MSVVARVNGYDKLAVTIASRVSGRHLIMPDRLDCPAHGNALTGAEDHGGFFEAAPPLTDVVLMNPPLLLADDHTLF